MSIVPSSQDENLLVRNIDRVLSIQRPVVIAHIRAIRSSKPNATPDEIITTLEKRYLAAVTTGGAAVGASAVVPAVGMAASLALSSVETVGFLEATALFAQSVTEVHGIAVDDPDRARALVMTMLLGQAGKDLVRQLAGEVTGGSPNRSAFWGEVITRNVPRAAIDGVADRIRKTFLKRYATAQGTNVIGRMVPFGIGAVIGGTGNHILGRRVVRSARDAFGPPPPTFPLELEPPERVVRLPKQPRSARPSVRRRPQSSD